MEEKFITGLFTSRRDNAPEFLLASLSFKTEAFIEWLKNHTNIKGYVNVDVLKSKEGKVYSKLNDWTPTGDSEKFVKKDDKIVVGDRFIGEADLMELEFGKDEPLEVIPF
jgi:hypothetical protein